MKKVTIAGDGATASFKIRSSKINAFADGTFGGGTVQMQISPDDVTWFDVPSASLNAKGVVDWYLMANYVRANVTGSVTPSVTLWIFGV